MPTIPNTFVRPPTIAVMGHIDHGKSSLLDAIRKTNVVAHEAGGITQHISAWEVVHTPPTGGSRTLVFLDTPGHEAFQKMRSRGAHAADIAILVVSAEDGVKPQTLEAFAAIKAAGIPFVVAITKIDKANADVERTKANILEHGIYLEGLGGDVPFVPLSSKSGVGISELLDILLLIADLKEFSADLSAPAQGVIIESNLDARRGISATLIVKNGTLYSGSFIVAGDAWAPVRIMEDYRGNAIREARAGSVAHIVGFSTLPPVGSLFEVVEKKRDAEERASAAASTASTRDMVGEETRVLIPLLIKADVAGSLEAIEHEIAKIPQERIRIVVLGKSVGAISEGDIKAASGKSGSIVVGFNVSVDTAARDLAERFGVEIATFTIIYELAEWLAKAIKARTPVMDVEEGRGAARVLKVFSVVKSKQIIGGTVESGVIRLGDTLKIIRRGTEIGRAKVLNLQQQKADAKKIDAGSEFGAQVDAKIEIASGDTLESFVVVKK